jgi:hypothetical protein
MVPVKNLEGDVSITIPDWTATIFLHADLQVVYYNCVKFHKNPIN